MNEIEKREEKAVEYIPYGAADKIKLSVDIIKKLVAVPTKSGKTCSDRDAIKFLMLCQAKRLNPFEGDCFLIGYDSQDGVATFPLITAHQAFLKRAEVHPEYDGMESGVILADENGLITDIEGDFYPVGQEVVGGWAKVYFKNRKIPTKRRIRLERFRKSFGVWKDDPAGMIVKCAEADALRSSFPTMLGGLLMRDEAEFSVSANGAPESPSLPLRTIEAVKQPEQILNAKPEPAAEPPGPSIPGKELGQFVAGEGFTWEQFSAWAIESGNIENIGDLGGYDEIPATVARRLLRAKSGLITGLQKLRELQSK